MRILNSGGLTFNGDSAAVNALNDYEEGTWTPAWSGTSATYNTQLGTYKKIGSCVYAFCRLDSTNLTYSGTTSLVITGLPFASSNTTGYYALGTTFATLGFNNVYNGLIVQVSPNQTQGSLYGIQNAVSNVNYVTINSTHVALTSNVIMNVSFIYQTDA